MSAVEIVFTGKNKFDRLAYADGPLGPTEVGGRTLATLVSPGTELAWAGGDNFPIRPGYSAVFEVDRVGSAISDIKRGDRLFCMGAHRSTQQFDVRYTLPLPMGMTPETALIARLMGVSMTTLTTTKARPGDKVIVSGAGPVGFLAAHQFHISGYDVHVVEPNERRRAQLAASGLTKLWAAMPLDNKALLAQVALVVDCSGHEGAVLDACRIVRQQGEVVLIGVPWRAQTSILAHEILQAVFNRYVLLRSGWEWELPLHGRSFVWEELYEGYNNAPHSIYSGFAKAFAWLEQGRIPLAGLMRKFPPTDPDSLYAALTRREIDEPFVVLDWSAGG